MILSTQTIQNSEQISAGAVSLNVTTPHSRKHISQAAQILWSPCRAGDVRLCCRANKTDYKRYISWQGVGCRGNNSATLTHTQTKIYTSKTGRTVLIGKRLCLPIKISQHALILKAEPEQELRDGLILPLWDQNFNALYSVYLYIFFLNITTKDSVPALLTCQAAFKAGSRVRAAPTRKQKGQKKLNRCGIKLTIRKRNTVDLTCSMCDRKMWCSWGTQSKKATMVEVSENVWNIKINCRMLISTHLSRWSCCTRWQSECSDCH